ncbi:MULTISPECIES: AzlD domain-containing protein [Haloferax]|uniref:AzlD domain-containing protein n=1 Tax=Haloferax marinum TaxID=2666143 RepID=A0A6A8GAN7_9EURY|nr:MULTISPECIES: AzlD domain-containing protein [Haloferax]KAB1198242.1 AzlD domain-containing protein [Haloferax sp. CBA1150]MRW97333.1 AzlD domain-containing protein [Haloferax marinum]
MPTGYDPTTIWGVIVAAGILTFAIRGSFIYLFGRIDTVPTRVKSALEYVPAAIFAALVLPALVAPSGSLELSLGNERLVAGTLAAIAAWYTERVVVTIAVGMIALWVLRFVL